MEGARSYIVQILASFKLRIIGIAIFVILSLVTLITLTSVKAHSESDEKYRQESIYSRVNKASTNQKSDNTIFTFKSKVIGMSFEVDKITPTPTPHIDPNTDDVWLKIADCESHKNWKADTGNGYYGGLQFSEGAWASVGGHGKASEASADEQITKGKLLQSRRGWGPWGSCSKRLGLL